MTFDYEPSPTGIARMTLKKCTIDPAQPENTAATLSALAKAVEDLAENESQSGAILILGAEAADGGDQPWLDIAGLASRHAVGNDAIAASDLTMRDSMVLRRMETCGKPIVAVIAGPVQGPGLAIALACHHRVAVKGVSLAFPEVTLGLLPSFGGAQRLARLAGIAAAVPLALTGKTFDAKTVADVIDGTAADLTAAKAMARGWLVTTPEAVQPWDRRGYVIPGGSGPLAPFAGEVFQANTSRIKAHRACYPADLAILSAIYEGTLVPMDAALRIDADYTGEIMADPVAGNLLRHHRNIRRAARPAQGKTDIAPPRRIGVLGAGMMGRGIANAAAAAGCDVVLLDRTEEDAHAGIDRIRQLQERDVARGRLTSEDAAAIMSRITPTAHYAALGGSDLVIEAVFEDRALKADVFARSEAALDGAAVIASNTSTLPITGLARAVQDPARFIGLHFFSPVERMPLVEVIKGRDTAPETLSRALAFVTALGKTPVVVQDSPGFYTSRVFCTYIDEAMAMLAEGVSPALIENAARQAGFPVPPLAVADEVSLDLQRLVIDQARADGLDARFLRAHCEPVVARMIELDRLGRKSNGGFYTYPTEGAKHLWSGLATEFAPATTQPEVTEVANRLLFVQAAESLRCLSEGVIADAAAGDMGSVLGIGYPAWTGGALSVIQTVGRQTVQAVCEDLAFRIGDRFAVDPAVLAHLEDL